MTKNKDKPIKDIIISALFRFLKREFPDNATSWRQSTDEISTIGYKLYNYISEFKGETVAQKLSNIHENSIFDRSISPSERNIKFKKFITKAIKIVDIQFLTELIAYHGHWFLSSKETNKLSKLDSKYIKTLNESQQMNQEISYPENNLTYLTNKSKQFTLECGLVFENLIDPKVPKIKNSLIYWINNSSNFDDFLTKITEFIVIMQGEITDEDIVNLKLHINKYSNGK